MKFSQLSLSHELLLAVSKEGFAKTTKIQEEVIPLALKGLDILAKAQTGSGKTASFVLPILEYLVKNPSEGKPKIRALVLTPTRELTLQVAEAFERFGAYMPKKLRVTAVIGGQGIGDQLFELQKGCDIVVATAGRFLDVLSKKQITLAHLRFLVLDEADKMLDIGFTAELDMVLEAIPKSRQSLLFSATYPQKVLDIASKISPKYEDVTIEGETQTVDGIAQRVIEVNRENRGPLLRHLLQTLGYKHVLVFMANKRATDNIMMKFRKYGIAADSFHGDLMQDERIYTLERFKSKKTQVLFSTDIAARGIDIDDLECVVNFDLPRAPSDYVHRIGRTGRAGKSGVAISFISHEDMDHFELIEKRVGIKLPREQIEGFELSGVAAPKPKGGEPVKGKRKSKKDKLREQLTDSKHKYE